MRTRFEKRLQLLQSSHKELILKHNKKQESENGVYNRYAYAVLTVQHTPVFWRYDINYETNPYLMERFEINGIISAGAIKLNGKYIVLTKMKGNDGHSFFAVAESANGVDNFECWEYPLTMLEATETENENLGTRIMQHEDGWYYIIFAKDNQAAKYQQEDQPLMKYQYCISRTKDLKNWERLPDFSIDYPEYQGIILHPELINGKYGFYFFPGDDTGRLGIKLGLSESTANVEINEAEMQTLNSPAMLAGPAPLKTQYGWLHLAHATSNTAAGHRSAMYIFMTDLKAPTDIIYKPVGYFMSPAGDENGGIGPHIISSNGWIMAEDGSINIYYTSSDKRLHVATTTLDQLLDYVMYATLDATVSSRNVSAIYGIIDNNRALMHLKLQKQKSTH